MSNQANNKCGHCQKTFATPANVTRHIKTVYNQKEKKRQDCESCDKSFSRADYLRIHIKSVHEGRKYECESFPQLLQA